MLVLTARNIRNYWAKVDRGDPDACWHWIGGKTSDGYGAFGVAGRQYVATHIALTLDGKPRPSPEHHALHGDCSAPGCVNPAHLRWGLNQENVDDKLRLGRLNHFKGEQHPKAKLSPETVALIRSSPDTGVALAARLGVSKSLISLVRNGKNWTHVA